MTNSAGLSFLSGSVLDANFSLMVPSLHFTNGLNDAVGKTNYFPLPGLAYVNHQESNPLTWGVGVFTQGGMGSGIRSCQSFRLIPLASPLRAGRTVDVDHWYPPAKTKSGNMGPVWKAMDISIEFMPGVLRGRRRWSQWKGFFSLNVTKPITSWHVAGFL